MAEPNFAVLQRIVALEAAVQKLLAFARDVDENYDHDEDAHRYGYAESQCRCCKAEAIQAKYSTLIPATTEASPSTRTVAEDFAAMSDEAKEIVRASLQKGRQ